MKKILDNLWFGLCIVSCFWVFLFMLLAPLVLALTYKGYLALTYFFYLPLIEEFYPEEKKLK